MKHNSSDQYLNGEYYIKNPTWGAEDATWKATDIYNMMTRHNITAGSITEVGCGTGGILMQLAGKDQNIPLLTGYDISPQAIALARQHKNERVIFHLADYLTITTTKTNLLLVIDVLEHVDDYYCFLRMLKARSDHFIFHIPLDLCCRTLLKPHVLLQQREAVGHIHYFTREMVLWMLHDTGYEILDWHYTKPTVDFYPAGSVKRGVKKILRNFSFMANRHLSASLWGGYSMLILAK